jgi:hypothetical protein
MAHVDEALKLDVQKLMADVLKEGKHDKYFRAITFGSGQISISDLSPWPVARITVWVTVRWPAAADTMVPGDIQIRYMDSDGSAAEQTLRLTGTPAKIGGVLWRVTCPVANRLVQSIFLGPDGERFLSREAAGLKYRRANGKAERAWRRGQKLMRKLQTDHWGPGIGKPEGMSDRQFQKLEYKLVKEHLRYLCAQLGEPDPEFYDEEPAPRKKPQPRPNNQVRDHSLFTRQKSGELQMKSRLRKSCGLPAHEKEKLPNRVQ